jgi:hypothetical protein
MRIVKSREFGNWQMAFLHKEESAGVVMTAHMEIDDLENEVAHASALTSQILTLFREGAIDSNMSGGDESGAVKVTIRSGKSQRADQYLVDLGRVISLTTPGVSINVVTHTGEIGYNQRGNLNNGDVELF